MPTAPAHSDSRARHAVPRRPLRRVLTAIGVMLAMLLVAGSVAAFLTYYKLDRNISSNDVTKLLGTNRPKAITEGKRSPENILLIGSDTRAGTNQNYGKSVQGARSDTTILLHLAADRKSATAVSIPRDTVVDIPTCDKEDGSVIPGSRARINDAFSRGGPACTIRTIESLSGVFIGHYVVIDFTGFKQMVNALGGVEICLPKRVDDQKSRLHLDAGRQLVRGKDALAYVRTRHALGDGSDLGRIDRQQAFLSSMIARVRSTGILRADRLVRFLDAATKSITTDPGLASLNDLRKLAQTMQGVKNNEVTFLTIPNKADPAAPQATVVQKQPAADAVWSSLRFDTPLPGKGAKGSAKPSANPSGAPLKTFPGQIKVEVLNASGRSGAANALAQQLEAAGFVVTGVGTAPRADLAKTEVHHSVAYDESARTLGAALSGAPVKIDPTLPGSSTLTVLVGADNPHVVPVQVAGSPAPAAAEPSIATRSGTQDICS